MLAKHTGPQKPYKGFPLFVHQTKRWAKKIRGKFHYFGPVTPEGDYGAMAALGRYEAVAAALHDGRSPQPDQDGLTVRELANHWLASKTRSVEAHELAQRTFDGYHQAAEGMVKALGGRPVKSIVPEDLARFRAQLAKRLGPTALAVEVGRLRGMFRYGYEAALLDQAVRFGPGFRPPSRAVLRRVRAERGPLLFEPAEIHKLLDRASVNVRAMILLGVQAGMGNCDLARLPIKALDLDGGWLSYPRPKTGVARRVPLWVESVEAIEHVLARRPRPRGPAVAKLVFLTIRGDSYANESGKDAIGMNFVRLCRGLGLYRPQRGFYTLRRVFETQAGETRDQPAVDAIMGHIAGPSDMAAIYRQSVSDARLLAVADHVRSWLFGSEKNK